MGVVPTTRSRSKHDWRNWARRLSGFTRAENHIPGALYLDTNRLENPIDWNRRPPDELDEAMRSLGITRDTTVILYGRDTEGHASGQAAEPGRSPPAARR